MVLMLPGGGGYADSGFRRITKLERDYRVISVSYPLVSRVSQWLEGLDAILKTEGGERTHLVGQSLGAAIAHCFARSCPRMTDKIVLSGIGIPSRWRMRASRIYTWLLGSLPDGTVHTFYTRRLSQLTSGQLDADEQQFLQAFLREYGLYRLDKKAMISELKCLMEMFSHPDAYHIFDIIDEPGKVLIFEADQDTGFGPSERQQFKALYPSAQTYTFRNAGHLALYTHAEEYDAVLMDFLKR
jgi:pimeloyl-ACP methyl ester carboxylesterase